MRAIILGSQSVSYSAAYHLAKIGYEVTVIEHALQETPQSVSAQSKQTQHCLFPQDLQVSAKEKGVNFINSCKIQRFMTDNKRVRGIVFTNARGQLQTIMCDKFISDRSHASVVLLKPLGIYLKGLAPAVYVKPPYFPLLSKTLYSNLYLYGVQQVEKSASVFRAGELLADFIHDASSVSALYCKPACTRVELMLSKFFYYVRGLTVRLGIASA